MNQNQGGVESCDFVEVSVGDMERLRALEVRVGGLEAPLLVLAKAQECPAGTAFRLDLKKILESCLGAFVIFAGGEQNA